MFKKTALSAIALLGVLAVAPHDAKAAVRVGVVVGAPAYPVYPVCPPAIAVAPAPILVRRPWEPVVRWDRRHDVRFRR